jgi:transcription antitermination factor NusG
MDRKKTSNESSSIDPGGFPDLWKEPQWYAAFVRSNQEWMIAQRLEYFEVEHFLPSCRVVHQWKDRIVKLDRPLFPGYVFVHIPFMQRARVLTLPNVVSLVGTKNAPSVIAEEEIAWIKAGVDRANAEPHPYLKVGERVVITQGALAGAEGMLLRIGKRSRVVIAVESINRAFSVEVDEEAISAPRNVILGASRETDAQMAAITVQAKGSLA